MRIWCKVRNFASLKFRLTPGPKNPKSSPCTSLRDPLWVAVVDSVAILFFWNQIWFILQSFGLFFAIWFVVYFIVYFLIFWFIFSFFEDVLRQVSAVFPGMIYVWFWRFKENLSKLYYSHLFWARVCPYITLFVPTRTSILQPLTGHVVDFSNARPYFGCETETLIRNMVCSESDDESARNPNYVSISVFTLCLF